MKKVYKKLTEEQKEVAMIMIGEAKMLPSNEVMGTTPVVDMETKETLDSKWFRNLLISQIEENKKERVLIDDESLKMLLIETERLDQLLDAIDRGVFK